MMLWLIPEEMGSYLCATRSQTAKIIRVDDNASDLHWLLGTSSIVD